MSLAAPARPLAVGGLAALTLALTLGATGSAVAEPVTSGLPGSVGTDVSSVPITVECFTDADQPMVSGSVLLEYNLGDGGGVEVDPAASRTVGSTAATIVPPAAPGDGITFSTDLDIAGWFAPAAGQTLVVTVTCEGFTATAEFPDVSLTTTTVAFVAPDDRDDPEDPEDPGEPVDPGEPLGSGGDPASGDTLAETGQGDSAAPLVAGALLLGGAALVVAARRRARPARN